VSSNAAQTEVIFVFIVFLLFSVISGYCPNFNYTTNEPAASGHASSIFFGEESTTH
jgi:hypothetical protein